MKKKLYSTAIALAAFVGLSSVYFNSLITTAAVTASAATPSTQVVSEFSADRYLDHVRFLSRDEMKGRGNGTPELDKAAEYIASQFHVWGLQPAGDNGTFFQQFDVITGTEFGPKNQLEVEGRTLVRGEDFVPIAFSRTGDVEGPVVFAGYGITAPEMHYDDYRGIDAKEKIVVVFRHEPQELDEKSPFNGKEFTTHASFINKAINARQHGARAIIFITDPNAHPGEPDAVGDATRSAEAEDIGIPSVHALRMPIMAMFNKAGKDLTAIQRKIDSDLEGQSFELPAVTVKVSVEVNRIRKSVRNVVAALPSQDPALKDEWVVMGAHYDHLGLGGRSSLAPSQTGQVHHGADDNASGTAAVLELARMAAQNRQDFKRSLLFMTFAGEELGLLGSSHFVDHPTIPLNRIVGMMNLDMVGRLTNSKLFIGGVGTSPDFKSTIEALNESAGLMLDYSDSGYGSSDHTSFYIKGIPVLFFFSGLHADYHKPSDTYDKINADGALKVMSLVYMMAADVANKTARPQYTKMQAERPAGGGGGGYGPYFGSIPDFREDLNGVLFADVTPNSPAAKAGLKAGDLMTQFDGKSIQNLYDFTYALRAKQPGEVVVVVVKRGAEEVRVDVKLEARK